MELLMGNRIINDRSPCFVIAEIGHNHQGSLEICKRMFEAAKSCDVDAVKLQKRSNRELYTEQFYNSPYNSENAFGPTYGLHREALELSNADYYELKQYAKQLDLIFFATAFDFTSADFLHELGMPCFKIASGDLTNTPLLKYVASFGKPMIISTGAALMADVERAFEAVIPINNQIALLQCTAIYPTEPEKLDLNVIGTYLRKFPKAIIGLSDHYNGIALPVAAYILGARILEKHFTLSHATKGTDHAFSIEPTGMRRLVRDLKRTYAALGDGTKNFYPEEKPARLKMGKKIVAAKKLQAGHIIGRGDLNFKSPGDGLEPYYAEEFYGKTLKVSLKKDEAISFEHI
ncbi:MAG: N-acetylneuraminate synthase family protein [Candidatus Yanofskybacteria bacterium]|nr:N-acetylneuraminate synthase family protein [Candidatus Yanofskybacteria bacterium]